MYKIVILGPESSGKTTLATQLAIHYQGVAVPEFAREYLENHGSHYDQRDLLRIADGQIKKEEELTSPEVAMMFLDTDLTVIKIWSEFKFGTCHSKILEAYHTREYDYYLLTYPDLKWESDPLRESENELHVLFDLYKTDLESRGCDYDIIKGVGEERFQNAVRFVESFLG